MIANDRGPFIYYESTFLGFLDRTPYLRKHVFSTENKHKLAFSDYEYFGGLMSRMHH